jgi:anti-sigma factor RsiW
MDKTFRDHPLDDKLSAWLDGELTTEQRAEVDQWLREHPDDAARVRLWAADRDVLRARLDAALDEPVPTRLEQVVWNQAPATAFAPRWQRVAAGIVIFALGSALGAGLAWRWPRGAADAPEVADSRAAGGIGWERRAALAHSVYTPEVRHPVEVAVAGKNADESRAQEDHLSRWLTKRLGMPVKLFDLRAQGYELVGGRLLPDTPAPSAQLMYQRIGDPMAPRVTVYLRKPDVATPAAFRYERQDELGMFYWVEGATGYALVGNLPKEKLLALSEAIYRQGAN